MPCFGTLSQEAGSEAAVTYLDVACVLDRAAESLSSTWFDLWVAIAIGVAPFLYAFIRGKAGYPTLAVIAVVSVYASFATLQGVQTMDSEIARVQAKKVASHFGARPVDALKLADAHGLRSILESVTQNNREINHIALWLFLLKYVSGCLVVIAGWSSTTIMSRRIRWTEKGKGSEDA